jgi:hypothetical protein
MKIAFSDGTASLVQTGGTTFSLGGQAISKTVAVGIGATTMGSAFNTTIKSALTTGVSDSATTSKVKVFLDQNDSFNVLDNNTTVNGLSGGNEKVTIGAAITGTKTDANLEGINLLGTLTTYQFKVVSGTGIQIVDASGVAVATVPSINANDMKLAFSDGSASLVQTGGTAFTLGGQTVSKTVAGGISATTMGTAFNTAITSSTPDTTPTTSTINVSSTSTTPILTSAADTIVFAAGNYDVTLSGFAVGDKIDLPATFLTTLNLSNTSATDNTLVLQADDGINSVISITLTGISSANDASIYSIDAFKSVFGATSLF